MKERILTLEEIKEKAIPIAKKYGMEELYLFGSYARGEASSSSDIDFYYKGKPNGLINHIQIEEELEAALGKKVDLLTEKQVYKQPVHRLFPELELNFTRRVEREKELIYG